MPLPQFSKMYWDMLAHDRNLKTICHASNGMVAARTLSCTMTEMSLRPGQPRLQMHASDLASWDDLQSTSLIQMVLQDHVVIAVLLGACITVCMCGLAQKNLRPSTKG